jgi:hypothetical protein
MVYAHNNLIVPGDASATVDRIENLNGLYRASIGAALLSQIFMFLLGLTLFFLFQKTSFLWSTVLIVSMAISVAIGVASAITSYAVLTLVSGADYLRSFGPDQINALAMVFLRLSNAGQALLEIFWTPFFVSFGLLALRSRQLPRLLGVLLILMGVGYFVNVFTKLLVPHFFPDIFLNIAVLLGALGGVSTILWLLIMGAKEHAS